MAEFGRYPVSVAGDADTEGGLFTPQFDTNGMGRIFECIVQQVAQYLGNGFAVDSSSDFFFGNIDRLFLILLDDGRFEAQDGIFQQCRNIGPGKIHLEFVGSDLLEIE